MKGEYIYFPQRDAKRLREANAKKGDEYFKRAMREGVMGTDSAVSKTPMKRKSQGTKNYD